MDKTCQSGILNMQLNHDKIVWPKEIITLPFLFNLDILTLFQVKTLFNNRLNFIHKRIYSVIDLVYLYLRQKNQTT